MMDFTFAIVWKDLKREFRSKETFATMLMFILLVIFGFRFAFLGKTITAPIIASIIWGVFLFSGLFTLFNSFAKEKDTRCFEGLLLCPGDRSAIYLGKMISTLILTYIVELIGIVMMEVFFPVDILVHASALLPILFLGTAALVSVGTIISAISVRARSRQTVLPVLLIPLILLTVIVPAVSVTTGVLTGKSLFSYSGSINTLIGFTVVYIAIALMIFDEVLVR
ncbi:MAG: heme exporter protein CcmB [Candidatus Aenigmatarchaeota archaeon]